MAEANQGLPEPSGAVLETSVLVSCGGHERMICTIGLLARIRRDLAVLELQSGV